MSFTSPAKQLESLQITLKGLKLPITIEHFRSLPTKQQNDLVSEQIMGWQLYEWDEECSGFTPGAEWQYGGDHYAQPCTLRAPAHLDGVLEADEAALLNWVETYGSRDWVTDIGAAMKLLEALQNLYPVVSKHTPTAVAPWSWSCRLVVESETVCWQGETDFAGLPTAIAIACLEAVGGIDNSPLAQTSDIEGFVLQAAQLGPLADVPVSRVNTRLGRLTELANLRQ